MVAVNSVALPPTQKRALSMNTIKILFLVLGVCSICSKAAIHTWRHFHPPVPVAAWR
jgi:hypothetical protein